MEKRNEGKSIRVAASVIITWFLCHVSLAMAAFGPSHYLPFQGRNSVLRSAESTQRNSRTASMPPRIRHDPMNLIGPLFGSTDTKSAATGQATTDDNSDPSKVEQLLNVICDVKFPHRIVVVGNGAILESTWVLDPPVAVSTSPKTGERLATLASEDKSFEFHLKIDSVTKVTFSEVERPLPSGESKTLRITRFHQGEGSSSSVMCSLILADSTPPAAEWFSGLIERFGAEFQI